jgi:CubicO group peptidase (beta-lactamase class C family)
MKHLTILLCLLAFPTLAAQAPALSAHGASTGAAAETAPRSDGAFQQFDGHWSGAIKTPSADLPIEIDISKELQASITIAIQNIKNWRLTNVKTDGAKISFDMPNIPGNPHFDGTLSADGKTIAGDFMQGGAKLTFSIARGAAPAARAADAMSGFDDLANGALKSWNAPGMSMAIVSGGKVAYAKGFGRRDVKNSLAVTPDTLFAIGSCTKAFTTFMLGQLVDEGKLEWDKPVARYLPGFRLADAVASQELTPRDLITHRSGLPRHDMVWYNNQTLSRKDLVERLQFLPANAELRQKYQYNNLMFLTAGYLIEQLTGKSWEENVRTRVFGPAGMTHSVLSDADAQKSADFAKPYRDDHDKLIEIPYREVGNMGPAGSISSSANDMAKWMLVQLGDEKKELIQPSTLRELHTPQMTMGELPLEPEFGPPAYAMGWVVDTYRGHLRISHGGSIDGFSALVTLFPNDDIGIVSLVNANGSPLPDILTLHAADRLLNLEPHDWNTKFLGRRAQAKEMAKEAEAKKNVVRKTGTKPAHKLDEYTGDYENPGYGIVAIAKSGDALKVTYNGISAPLEHWHYETFNALKSEDPTLEDTKVNFLTDMNGNVSGLSVAIEPSVPEMTFNKRPDAQLSDPAFLQKFTGAYELGPVTADVSLRGTQLVMTVTGQPPYTLIPALDGWFDLKGLTGFRAKFEATGKEITVSQPNGVFTAKRRQ